MLKKQTESPLQKLIIQLSDRKISKLSVIPYASPIISFGDYTNSIVATMGLNPSDREFLDSYGVEISGKGRRFHTLNSLGLNDWSQSSTEHLSLIENSCKNYFSNNPYNTWFRDMEEIISGTGFSLYKNKACHLDLIPYATMPKWAQLKPYQKNSLLALSKAPLETVLLNSKIELIVLNGKSVVEGFQKLAGIQFKTEAMSSWDLTRRNNKHVKGFSFKAKVTSENIPNLDREITILGFNHNLQSSFGVTSKVKKSIKQWITQSFKEANR